jgi:hypothetical protein
MRGQPLRRRADSNRHRFQRHRLWVTGETVTVMVVKGLVEHDAGRQAFACRGRDKE